MSLLNAIGRLSGLHRRSWPSRPGWTSTARSACRPISSIASIDTELRADLEQNTESPQKLASRVARAIRHDIVDKGWPVGAVLGSEPDLLNQYGVSRAVYRESVRLLEHLGVATTRRGPGGGLVVTEPPMSTAVNAVVASLLIGGISFNEVMEVRDPLEQAIAALAAERADDHHIDGLRRLIEHEGLESTLDPERHHELHAMIARAAGNPAGELFVEILTRLTYQWTHPPVSPDRAAAAGAASMHDHEAIVEAISGGNTNRSQTLMHRHLNGLARWVAENSGEPILRPWAPMTGEEKVGELLAGSIAVDIVAGRYRPGDVLGSEPELIARLGVSRAAFREAVRLLEHQRLAVMRKGVHGGLTITAPDVSAIVDAATVYLEYRKITATHLMEMREALELKAIELAAKRMTPDDADRLRSVMEAERSVEYTSPRGGQFHYAVADVAGNRALTLFVRVLARLTMNFAEKPPRPSARFDELAGETHAAHAAIVLALANGDAQLARRRMHKHLAALDPLMH